VYFVAGDVVYRVDAATGAICWKQTLNVGGGLTDLAFVDGVLRVSGPNVLVRVMEREPPVEPKPPAPAAPKPDPMTAPSPIR